MPRFLIFYLYRNKPFASERQGPSREQAVGANGLRIQAARGVSAGSSAAAPRARRRSRR